MSLAAEQGDPRAQTTLGTLYEMGEAGAMRIPNWPMYEDDLTIWQRRAWPGLPKPRHFY